MKQESLFREKTRHEHGGTLARGRRKTARPLSAKKPIHVVLKSRRGIYAHRLPIATELRPLGARFGLRIYGVAVNHDHLHVVIRLHSRRLYRAFIRAFTGLLARRFGKGLWTLFPFTRIGTWGRAFQELLQYLRKNRAEASGERPYEPRKGKGRARTSPLPPPN